MSISITRRSMGKADKYEVGKIMHLPKCSGGGGPDGHYFRVVKSSKYRDDDTDEWMLIGEVVAATADEAAPVAARIVAKALAETEAKALAGALREVRIMGETDARLFYAPKDVIDLWIEQRAAGSERWTFSPTTGIIYYAESSYDDGPATWATSATREQVEALKATGLYRPSLLSVKK